MTCTWPLAMALALLPASALLAGDDAAPSRPPADLFAQKCADCHGPNGWGTRALAKRMAPAQAELLKRKTIPAALVKHVVRRGVNSMPPFTPTDLTDRDLERLARWLESGR